MRVQNNGSAGKFSRAEFGFQQTIFEVLQKGRLWKVFRYLGVGNTNVLGSCTLFCHRHCFDDDSL